MRVDFDRYSLRVDGRRVLVRAGSLHYFRLPSAELWRERLALFRDAILGRRSWADAAPALLALLVFAAVFVALGLLALGAGLRHAKRVGGLGGY